MKIDFSRKLLNHSGEAMLTEKGEEFTLGNACVTALDARTDETSRIDGEEKNRRGALADRIYRTKEPIEIKVEDVALLKTIIGKIFGPHAVFEAWKMLDSYENIGAVGIKT